MYGSRAGGEGGWLAPLILPQLHDGKSHSFGGTYLKLVPGELLVYTDAFDDPDLPGEMKVTVKLKAVSVGTEMTVMQENLPEMIPVEACYLGWQESLRKLAKLVEPEIKD